MIGRIGLVALGFVGIAHACDCSIYPFEPNPPCVRECVKKLTLDSSISLNKIQNIDPTVAHDIWQLRSYGAGSVDFSKLNSKADLESFVARWHHEMRSDDSEKNDKNIKIDDRKAQDSGGD